MLDQNVLNSVLAGNTSRPENKKEETVDAEAFGSALNEASQSKPKGKAKEESKAESKDAAKKAARDKEAHEQEEARNQPVQDKTAAIQMRKLMTKNVDTLSLAEKQALRIAEFADESHKVAKAPVAPGSSAASPASPSRAGKAARVEDKAVAGREASTEVRKQADRAEERQQVAEEAKKLEQPKGSGNLEQLLNKEASFAEEIRKTSQVDRARERQSVIDQIMQQIEVRNFANRTELHMKLNPEYLGELKVKLVHTDDGIRADFETSSKATRAILRECEDDLRTQAAGKGVRMRAMRFTLVEKVDDVQKA